MPRPLIHQMKLPRRLVLERMNRLLREQQWSFKRPRCNALSIELIQQPSVVGVGAFLTGAGAVAASQLMLKTRAFSLI